jgi:hypothetical protein
VEEEVQEVQVEVQANLVVQLEQLLAVPQDLQH